ncbi:hypothetical protein [Pseudidiomarina andamanensis]|uniref:Uncharacterized protein n=1 Tax=Pseudidiomarina andamanensis TaxID=1940690 RepID=A0AA92ES17_9GAMM|nr:hypothetical protein [Pseudidiomarina andamanensis]MDS0218633.1 hypothetical protein [Pseudidiomarina andamanensis]QGT95498.1 hypothetical protein D3795_04580 [Pseudidiomarina andamanensis]
MPREQHQNFDISIHYSGDIVTNDHKIGLRTYANTLHHLSAAVDRALLSHHRGRIHKNARITRDERAGLDFIVLDPEDNGIVLKFIANQNNPIARFVTEKIANYLEDANRQEPQATITPAQIRERIAQIQQEDEIRVEQMPDREDDFAKKAICREINSILGEIRHEHAGQSQIRIELKKANGETTRLEFNRFTAENFNRIVNGRSIIGPFLYQLRIKALDLMNQSKMHAKCIDVVTGKQRTLYFKDLADLQRMKEYLTTDDEISVNIYGFSITEFNVVDNIAGDIHFIAIQE